ncbi:MAG: imidazolonepropionase [bacterium]
MPWREDLPVLLSHFRELYTLADEGEKSVIKDGAVYIKQGKVHLVGTTEEVYSLLPDEPHQEIEVKGYTAVPGFIDCHTHLPFAGTREGEFQKRLRGISYAEIQREGGGIYYTARLTQQMSERTLTHHTLQWLKKILLSGTTTVEMKTGYGIYPEKELHFLGVIEKIAWRSPVDIVPTLLAHLPPPERNREELVKQWRKILLEAVGRARFVDVFCDPSAFTLEEARTILSRAKELGFGVKIHAEEFGNNGATQLAARLKAISADHLLYATRDDIRALKHSGTVAVVLPMTNLSVHPEKKPPIHWILEEGVPLAIATDFNPGTSFCYSLFATASFAIPFYRLPAEIVLQAITKNSARALGLSDRGFLAPGSLADLVILDFPSLNFLGYSQGVDPIRAVIRKGMLYFRRKNLRIKYKIQ